MSIQILNCGTIRPYLPRVESGVTCILVETNKGLVLIDTGMGTNDYLRPKSTMRFFLAAMRSERDINETALYQIQQLGYKPSDIQHIVMTHLHFDHAGGLPDFPNAKVHIYKAEYDHIHKEGRAGWEYNPSHWAHKTNWVIHELSGDRWYDFEGIQLKGFLPEIWLIPLTGHSPGHSAVAIQKEDGWVLHAGDAVPFNMALDDVPQKLTKLLLGPHIDTIRDFIKEHPEVQVIGSHMTLDFYTA